MRLEIEKSLHYRYRYLFRRFTAVLIFSATMLSSSVEFAGFFQLLGGDVIRNMKVNLTPGHTRPDDGF